MHSTQSTEKISGEDWCTKCKQSVDEWCVFFEESIHADSGYDKVRRCPHCNAKCFEDDCFAFGYFVFFVGLFGLPILGTAVLARCGIRLELEDSGAGMGFLIGSILAAAILNAAVCRVWKWWLYRQR